MIKTAILFCDYERTTATERYVWVKQMQECLGVLCSTINFFSSQLDELAIISKYRVVSLPTFVSLDERGKVLARALRLPAHDELRSMATLWPK